MAANTQQGTYLATTLTGFTALTGGLVAKGSIGILVALVGLVLLIASAAGFRKIKDLG
jgi:4-amino-4-deoxy-L-arabinose transferase-like glycosyltransferase